MRKIFALLGIAVFSLSAKSFEGEYDFRGVRLGITLEEFKQLEIIRPAPKKELTRYPHYIDIPSSVVCSNSADMITKPFITAVEKNAGVVNCDYRYLKRLLPTQPFMGTMAQIQVADYSSDSYDFKFVKLPDEEEERLYSISIVIWTKSFQSVLDGLLMKFGGPSQAKKEMVQNRMGAQFENNIVVWENDTGSVILQKYGTDLEKGILLYKLKKYDAYLKKFYDAEKAKAGSKM